MYYLPHNSKPIFPPVRLAHESGLLAIGGKLNPRWIISAYRKGIFPWFNEGEPYCWFSPDPRLVLFPENLYTSKSMRAFLRKSNHTFSVDIGFDTVIQKCAEISREGQEGTWITDEMQAAYKSLHRLGYAHSFEWAKEGKITGGLYGLCINNIFFGESMFSEESNASKAAFILAVHWLQKEKSITLIDCQVETPHLLSFGAELIPRSKYIELLKENNIPKIKPEPWSKNFNSSEWKQFL